MNDLELQNINGKSVPKTVEGIMIQKVYTMDTEDTILQAAKVMNKHEIGCVVVTTDTKPVGILTERDILKRVVFKELLPAKTKVSEVMSKPIISIKPSQKIASAAQLMLKKNIKKLIVVEDRHLKGIISLTDLMPVLNGEREFSELASKAPSHVKKAFQIYYDPIRQKRKTCPLSMTRGMAISCLGLKCMWFIADRCVFLNLVERISA